MSKHTDHLKALHQHLWRMERSRGDRMYYPISAMAITLCWLWAQALRAWRNLLWKVASEE